MNARKLPSGRWQSKVYIGAVDGAKKFVTVTEDTRKECLLKAAQVKSEHSQTIPKITVSQAVEKYIEAKEGVLSPSTVVGYLSKKKLYIDRMPIGACRLDQLTPEKVQQWVSSLTTRLSKKSIQNAMGLLMPSVKMFYPKADLTAKLPQGKKYKGYVPSTEEVLEFLQLAREWDERLYRACLLAAFSTLRRSEIACLTADDLHGNILRVDKDIVRNKNGKWITKLPKTEDSVRDIPLPQWVADEMPKEGLLVAYRPDEITKWFGRVLKKSGLPPFRFHDLRKHAVSLMATKGVSMASIKEIGGWSNMQTPQQIYIKALADAHEREMEQYVNYVEDLKTAKL